MLDPKNQPEPVHKADEEKQDGNSQDFQTLDQCKEVKCLC